jgi:DNA-directed RNA polymerase specialized sigma24 family protein
MPRPFTPAEVELILHLYRVECLSYQQIAQRVGRNHSSIGYLIRREDLREEAALVAAEQQWDDAVLA